MPIVAIGGRRVVPSGNTTCTLSPTLTNDCLFADRSTLTPLVTAVILAIGPPACAADRGRVLRDAHRARLEDDLRAVDPAGLLNAARALPTLDRGRRGPRPRLVRPELVGSGEAERDEVLLELLHVGAVGRLLRRAVRHIGRCAEQQHDGLAVDLDQVTAAVDDRAGRRRAR